MATRVATEWQQWQQEVEAVATINFAVATTYLLERQRLNVAVAAVATVAAKT